MFTNNPDLTELNKENLIRKYGRFPPRPKHLYVNATDARYVDSYEGALIQSLELRLEYPSGTATLTAEELRSNKSSPVIVAVTYSGRVSDLKLSYGELLKRGFGVLCINAESVSSTSGEMRLSADKLMLPSRRAKDSAGKIALYAFSLTIAVDYLSSAGISEFISFGDSLFAEAALLAAAVDTRVGAVIADSPYITERSSRFFSHELYSLGYFKEFPTESPNLFSGIYPRRVILGYSVNAVPYELDLISEMLSAVFGAPCSDLENSLMPGVGVTEWNGCTLHLLGGAPILGADSMAQYLEEIKDKLSLEAAL